LLEIDIVLQILLDVRGAREEPAFRTRDPDGTGSSLILNGEMSEWSIEHAWKAIPLARTDAHQIPRTHFWSTTSRNNDLHQWVPANHHVCPGFRGACDTVL